MVEYRLFATEHPRDLLHKSHNVVGAEVANVLVLKLKDGVIGLDSCDGGGGALGDSHNPVMFEVHTKGGLPGSILCGHCLLWRTILLITPLSSVHSGTRMSGSSTPLAARRVESLDRDPSTKKSSTGPAPLEPAPPCPARFEGGGPP